MRKLFFAVFLLSLLVLVAGLVAGCEAIIFNAAARQYCSGLTLEQQQKNILCL